MPDPQPQTSKPLSGNDPVALARYLQGLFAPAQTGATDLLNQIARPGGIYDPTSDLAAAAQKSQIAAALPTQADIDAQQAGLQAKGADFLSSQLGAVPVPQEQPLEQPNLPQLQLPGLPQTAQPHVNPLASLIAIGAGFARPTGAGGFNASVLEGALQGAQQENERRQARDKADVARRAMLYDASMEAAREHQRITEANRDTAYRNSVATTDRQMMLAKAKTEQFQAHGAADSLKAFADKYDPALKARDEVKSLLDEIDLKGKASSERVKSISDLLSAVHKEDSAGPGMAKTVFDQIMEGTRDAAKDRAVDARQQQHDAAQANAAMARTKAAQAAETARTQIVQAHEDARAANANAAAMKRLQVEEAGRSSRQQKALREMKPSESLLQSRQNQARLQKDAGDIEVAISSNEADLETIRGGGSVNGLSGAEGVRALTSKGASLRASLDAYAKAIRQEQTRANRFKPAGGGASDQLFDPNTGEGILP